MRQLTTIQPNTEIMLMEKYDKSMLTVDEVAHELEIDPTDVGLLVDQGKLEARQLGTKQRIAVSSLACFLGGYISSEKHKLNDLLDTVLERKKLSCKKLSSYVWYCYHAEHIRTYFSSACVEDVTAKKLNNFLHYIAKGKNGRLMSEQFMKVIVRLLKNIFVLACKKQYIEKSPFEELTAVPTGKISNPKSKIISEHTLLKLNKVLNSSPIYKPMVVLMLRSGLRIGEVLGLRWSDIDVNQGVIHVEQSLSVDYDEDEKGNIINKHYELGDTKSFCSIRDVPVDNKVFDSLNEWRNYVNSNPKLVSKIKEKKNQDIVFVNKRGDLRSYQSLRQAFKRFLAKNNMGDIPITFHRFRHTYATYLQEAGVDVNVIRELLGHADLQTTTKVYINVRMKPMKIASQKLSSVYEKLHLD